MDIARLSTPPNCFAGYMVRFVMIWEQFPYYGNCTPETVYRSALRQEQQILRKRRREEKEEEEEEREEEGTEGGDGEG